jgi:hypothetical protein
MTVVSYPEEEILEYGGGNWSYLSSQLVDITTLVVPPVVLEEIRHFIVQI